MSAPGPRLELRQSQSLVMTLQLQQSIKLLQMSSQELVQFLEQEMEQNPLLTREEEGAASDESATAEEGEGEEVAGDSEERDTESNATDEGPLDGWENTEGEQSEKDEWLESQDMASYSPSGGDGEDGGLLERTVAGERSLKDHLMEQLTCDVEDPRLRMIGLHLIDMLDESGYLADDPYKLEGLLGSNKETIDAALHAVQKFDPPGIFARNLADCLSIQLREKNRLDPAMQLLLQNLDKLASGNHAALQKLCGVDSEDLVDMIAEIRALNPRPANAFQHDVAQPIEPDVFVRKAKGGIWQIELNGNNLPRVIANQRYYAQLSTRIKDKQEKKYLTAHMAQANWLVRSLEQRAETILKVSTEIVKQQDGFLRDGIHYMRPLTLKEVAAEVGLHESTVSRVTTAKFMATPRGTYELKYFFSSGLGQSSGGEDVSSMAVRQMIKELIDQEAPDAILSDDALADLLKGKGIEVARRTVTKYRESLHIGSSVQRRREKKLRPTG